WMTKIRNILIVPDKFKGSLTAAEVADALETAVRRHMVGGETARIVKLPMADGGDGSMEVVEAALGRGCHREEVDTFDALMRPLRAPLLLFDGDRQAFIEMAKVCGLAMLSPEDRNPEKTTTYGLGVLIAAAVRRGCGRIVIGIGGSATNDGGEGLLRALDELTGKAGFGGSAPEEKSASADRRRPVLLQPMLEYADSPDSKSTKAGRRGVRGSAPVITVACDVDNPLLGPDGATMVFGPQKGADAAMLERLERRMERFAAEAGLDTMLPGGGAAGGVGAALHKLGAELVPGWKLFGEMSGLEEKIAEAGLVITGEGSFDGQSLDGKLVDGILSLCRKHHKKPVVVCGRCKLPASVWRKAGIDDVYALSEVEPDVRRSIADAAALLAGSRTLAAGCDEAGRGCLAGPVFAAAVILPEGFSHPLLGDSKQLTEAQRDELRPIIEREAVAWSVTAVDAEEIDRINILNASIEGMKRSLDSLSVKPGLVLVDGNRFSSWKDVPAHTVVKGDATVKAIAAASVLAKTHRDAYMRRIAAEYPQYGWDRNKAYPTEEHRAAIRRYGITPYHRRSYNLLGDEAATLDFPFGDVGN
ncbi:MAG: ribonuclease HII, partial [Bacteroidales bacterium]|nr:ribonuclease HII [Bacteroidales bacterium]